MPNFVFTDNEKLFNQWKTIADNAGAPPFAGTTPNFVLEDHRYIWEQMERVVLFGLGTGNVSTAGLTVNKVPKASGATALSDSQRIDDGNNITDVAVIYTETISGTKNESAPVKNVTTDGGGFLQGWSYMDVSGSQLGFNFNADGASEASCFDSFSAMKTRLAGNVNGAVGNMSDVVFAILAVQTLIATTESGIRERTDFSKEENIAVDKTVTIGNNFDEFVTGNKFENVNGISGEAITGAKIISASKIATAASIQEFANNAAAIVGGLAAGDLYFTNVAGDGIVKVVI